MWKFVLHLGTREEKWVKKYAEKYAKKIAQVMAADSDPHGIYLDLKRPEFMACPAVLVALHISLSLSLYIYIYFN